MSSIYHIWNCHHFVIGGSKVIWYLYTGYWMFTDADSSFLFWRYLPSHQRSYFQIKQTVLSQKCQITCFIIESNKWLKQLTWFYIASTNYLSSFKQLLDEHWTDYHYFFNHWYCKLNVNRIHRPCLFPVINQIHNYNQRGFDPVGPVRPVTSV